MTSDSQPKPIGALSFEEALAELEAIVGRLEQGRITLDDAIGAYERGAALKQHCEAKLAKARERVETITVSASGQVAAEPSDLG